MEGADVVMPSTGAEMSKAARPVRRTKGRRGGVKKGEDACERVTPKEFPGDSGQAQEEYRGEVDLGSNPGPSSAPTVTTLTGKSKGRKRRSVSFTEETDPEPAPVYVRNRSLDQFEESRESEQTQLFDLQQQMADLRNEMQLHGLQTQMLQLMQAHTSSYFMQPQLMPGVMHPRPVANNQLVMPERPYQGPVPEAPTQLSLQFMVGLNRELQNMRNLKTEEENRLHKAKLSMLQAVRELRRLEAATGLTLEGLEMEYAAEDRHRNARRFQRRVHHPYPQPQRSQVVTERQETSRGCGHHRQPYADTHVNDRPQY